MARSMVLGYAFGNKPPPRKWLLPRNRFEIYQKPDRTKTTYTYRDRVQPGKDGVVVAKVGAYNPLMWETIESGLLLPTWYHVHPEYADPGFRINYTSSRSIMDEYFENNDYHAILINEGRRSLVNVNDITPQSVDEYPQFRVQPFGPDLWNYWRNFVIVPHSYTMQYYSMQYRSRNVNWLPVTDPDNIGELLMEAVRDTPLTQGAQAARPEELMAPQQPPFAPQDLTGDDPVELARLSVLGSLDVAIQPGKLSFKPDRSVDDDIDGLLSDMDILIKGDDPGENSASDQ